MTEAVRFLTTFTQALATMTLYEDGHPARERAVDTAYAALDDLQRVTARPLFTFLGEDVVCGKVPIRELKDWEWARRLSDAAVQRLEFDEEVGREDFELFLEEVLGRLTLSSPPSVEARPMRRSGVRFGAVGVRGETTDSEPPVAVAGYSLNVEADAIRWLHESYLTAAREFIRFQVANSRAVFGRDIHHVMLLHLGSFSSHILPDLFELLKEENFEIVTLEEAQRDAAYDYDPDFAEPRGGTLVELGMQAKNIPWPEGAPKFDRARLTSICQ